MEKTIVTCEVKPEWVDYNGHLNDAEYARVFSLAIDTFMEHIGMDQDFIASRAYSMFTLETHICYLLEANLAEKLTTTLQLLDHDAKRLHVFLTMKNAEGEHVATSEQMLMGMDMKEHRPAPFPEEIAAEIDKIATSQQQMGPPKEAGRTIGIRRK